MLAFLVWIISMTMGFLQSSTYAELAGMFSNKSGGTSVYGATAWLRYSKLNAGGIGITPFLAQIGQLSAMNGRFELHYSARSPDLGAYMTDLTARHGDRVHLYFDDQKQMVPLADLLAGQPLGTHLYVCGPRGMINWVRKSADDAGWPLAAVHHEEFLAPPVGQPFAVTLKASSKTILVGQHQSLLEAIEAPYLCRGGACGNCETDVLGCDGHIPHNDHWLTDTEKSSGTKIMPCVSRFTGRSLVLDR